MTHVGPDRPPGPSSSRHRDPPVLENLIPVTHDHPFDPDAGIDVRPTHEHEGQDPTVAGQPTALDRQ